MLMSVKVMSRRFLRVPVLRSGFLPGGVIGNTRVFDTRIPGSSPGRVSWKKS